MPIARRPTPPPEATKQATTVMDSLNAWTTEEDVDAIGEEVVQKLPLGYTCLAQADRSAPVEGWRKLFDSESDGFNAGIGLVIILNAIVIGLETDLGRGKFTVFENMFNIVFVLEMLTRIGHIGLEYFITPSYLFDCSLVISGTLDLWILPLFEGVTGVEAKKANAVGNQFTVLRLLRILRLLRVLRVIRLLRMFGQLLLMVKAFGKSIQVVLLLGVLVFIMMYTLGIVATQLVGHHSERFGDDADDVLFWFGTIPKSMTTLFWILFGSGWDTLLALLTKVYPTGLVLFFFSGYMVVGVALGGLIFGLISESLIIAQQEFKQRTLNKFAVSKKALAAEYTEELKELLEDEIDSEGCVEALHLKQAVKGDANLVAKLIDSGVQISVEGLLNLVDSMSQGETQNINIDHFIEKLINLSGQSTSSQIVDLKYDLSKNRELAERASKEVDVLKSDNAQLRQAMEALSKKMDQALQKMPR